jgi:hypothetical protein
MGIMGWSSPKMAAQHVTDPIRKDIAERVGDLIWSGKKAKKRKKRKKRPEGDGRKAP